MKLLFILTFINLTFAIASCKKCETCTPYSYSLGHLASTPDPGAQAITLCDEVDIKAYESLTNFTDAQGDTARFICK